MKQSSKQLLLQFFTISEGLNRATINSSRLFDILYVFIKLCLFSIEGKCIHSGSCCKHLNLVHNYKQVISLEQFKALLKDKPIMSSFKPVFKEASTEDIAYFSCVALDENNRCKQYAIRPDICRRYPFSVLANDGVINYSCGYKMRQDLALPAFASTVLKQKISAIQHNHGLL